MSGSQCCEHCAEIPELRKQIAELRARLDGLSDAPEDAEGSRPAQAKIEKPPAVQRPRQMVLPRPVDGVPLPQVDQESGIQDKLDLPDSFRGPQRRIRVPVGKRRGRHQGLVPETAAGDNPRQPGIPAAHRRCHYGASDEGQLRRLRTLRDAGR
jgi:hypothetical protein